MKYILFFIAIGLLLGGCRKQLTDVPEAPVVIKGYLMGGQGINDIYLENVATTREFEQQVNQPITNAEVKLLVNGQTIDLIPNPERAGFYLSETDSVLLDQDYELIVNYDGQTITASCYVPPQLEISNIVASDDILQNPSPEDVILSLSWDAQAQGIEYLISLIVDEEVLIPLPFGDEVGKFSEVYSLPIRDNFAQLDGSFFTYKGDQQITVYSISEEYSNYLSYLPTSFDRSLYNAPNNIRNGYGVFAGLTGSTVEFTLID